MDREAYDEIGDDGAPSPATAYGAAAVLGLTALVLAVCSVLGLGLLNGSTFVASSFDGTGDPRRDAVVSAVLGAALALLPLVLGLAASARVDDDDPAWVPTVARTAVLVAATSVLLRLAMAGLQAAGVGEPFPRF